MGGWWGCRVGVSPPVMVMMMVLGVMMAVPRTPSSSSSRFPVVCSVLLLSGLSQLPVLLADPVQLHLQLLNAASLGLQQLLLALDDVVELQQVLHGSVRGLLSAGVGARAGSPFHGRQGGDAGGRGVIRSGGQAWWCWRCRGRSGHELPRRLLQSHCALTGGEEPGEDCVTGEAHPMGRGWAESGA